MHRSQSKLRLQHVQQILSDAGYQTWATHRTRHQLIAALTIIVNQISAGTGRPVWKIWETALVCLRYTLKGTRFDPSKVRRMWARWPVDGERKRPIDDDADPKVCPCCGRPLSDDLPDLRETIDESPLEPLDPAEVPTSGQM